MRPCVRYEIGKCAGPCREEYKKEDYNGLVRGVKQLFDSGYNGIKALFENKMYAASERMDYERRRSTGTEPHSLTGWIARRKPFCPKSAILMPSPLRCRRGMPCLFALPCVQAG